MRKVVASLVVFLFAGLLGTSIFAVFHGATMESNYLLGNSKNLPNYMSY